MAYYPRQIQKKPCKHKSGCDNMPTAGMGGYCYLHEKEDPGYERKQARQVAKVAERKIKMLSNSNDYEIGIIQSLTNDLDVIFSNYIRLKYADTEGQVTCFVCEKSYHWKKLDCGHYISRGTKQTRFMEENCYPQCRWCNSLHNENPKPFKNAIDQYKSGITEYLEEIAADRSVYKYSQEELKQMLMMYRDKFKLLESKLVIV